ncbi:AAA family ATPase [Corynebacterium appendicis]|uniref:AAA family ATPase n=1 Tax=Corynebacterium appendicis TaxID=163202 RepID=UPI00254CC477|nr:AAA family ATPase [Corynebacterium appendicis]MDK8625690.1 AAA family ATPase [Corynebacterium appendicis]
MPKVQEIAAKKVLGEFDYSVSFQHNRTEHDRSERQLDSIRAIYGENGTGKTKFLNAIHDIFTLKHPNLVSLAEAEMEFLEVATDIGAAKFFKDLSDGNPAGHIVVTDHKNPNAFEFEWEVSDSGTLIFAEDDYLDLQSAARRVLGTAIYVRDDRVFNARLAEQSLRDLTMQFPLPPSMRRKMLSDAGIEPLSDLMNRLEDQFNRKILDITTGQQNGDEVFSALAKRVVGAGEDLRASEAREEIEDSIHRILRDGGPLENMKMIQLDSVRDIRNMIEEMRQNDRNFPVLLSILELHFNSIHKRIESLDPIRNEIEVFLGTANGFLRRKQFTFDSDDGLSLVGRTETLDDYSMLSSGERHLLTLLAQVTLADPDTTLIVVDEPEISLGLDWQRQILPALMTVRPNDEIRLLVASHSMQVTSELPLENIINPQLRNELV